jgi:hypothetical protein
MRGRKRTEESRAIELRERLFDWKQMPESSRPSLRALARELNTTHQLLSHYSAGLEEWKANEYWQRAKEIRALARANGRSMTPWEEEQSRALDRRALRLFIESSLDDHVQKLDREIEQTIRGGNAPAPQVSKMLRMIASTPGGPAAHRGAQRARAVLQKYFSPEGQKAVRERLRKAPPPPVRTVLKAPEARYRQIRLQKIVERFKEIGGVILLDEGQICYFVLEESAVSRALVEELVKYHHELKHVLELNPGKLDFRKVKAEICQRFPTVSLSPLDSHQGKRKMAGNSAGAREKEGGQEHAVSVSEMVPR